MRSSLLFLLLLSASPSFVGHPLTTTQPDGPTIGLNNMIVNAAEGGNLHVLCQENSVVYIVSLVYDSVLNILLSYFYCKSLINYAEENVPLVKFVSFLLSSGYVFTFFWIYNYEMASELLLKSVSLQIGWLAIWFCWNFICYCIFAYAFSPQQNWKIFASNIIMCIGQICRVQLFSAKCSRDIIILIVIIITQIIPGYLFYQHSRAFQALLALNPGAVVQQANIVAAGQPANHVVVQQGNVAQLAENEDETDNDSFLSAVSTLENLLPTSQPEGSTKSMIVNTAEGIKDTKKNEVEEVAANVGGWLAENTVNAGDTVADVKNKTMEKAEDIKEGVVEKAEDVKEAAANAGEKVKEVAVAAKDKVVDAATNLKNKSEEVAQKGAQKVEEFRENAAEKKDQAAKEADETVKRMGEKAQPIKDKAEEGVEKVKKAEVSVADFISQFENISKK